MINLFFIVHDYSGARTYADELLDWLSAQEGIAVHKVYLESTNHKEFTTITENNIVHLHIPIINSKNKHPDKLSAIWVKLMSPILSNKSDIIFHLNLYSHAYLGINLRKQFNVRLVFTLHFLPNYYSHFPINHKENSFLDIPIDLPHIYEKMDKIICVTNFAKDCLLKHHNVNINKLIAIHNGSNLLENNTNDCLQISTNKKLLKIQLGFSPKEKIILFVGRLEKEKGIEKLIYAFEQLKNTSKYRLVLIGDGEYNQIMNLSYNSIGRVSFTGRLSQTQVDHFYRIADIGVIPSEFEQCSFVALEMMRKGLPIIATNIPGLNELFHHRKDALLVPRKKCTNGLKGFEVDENSLADALKELIENRRLQKELGVNARKRFEQEFTLDHMGYSTFNLYKELIHG